MSEMSHTNSISPETITAERPAQDSSSSLEQLLQLFQVEQLAKYNDLTKNELGVTMQQQAQIEQLHKVLSLINATRNADGSMTVAADAELSRELAHAEELGVIISKTEGEFSSKDADRVVENVKMRLEDLETVHEMQLLKLTEHQSSLNKIYEMLVTIEKKLQNPKSTAARGIAGH